MNRSTHTVMSLELQAGGRWRLKSGQFAPLNNYLAPNIQNMHVTNVYSFITFHRELLQIHGTSCLTNQVLWKQPRYISEKYWPRWIEAKWELYLACGKWLFVPVNPLPLPHQTLAETCCFQMVAKLPWLEKKIELQIATKSAAICRGCLFESLWGLYGVILLEKVALHAFVDNTSG